MPDAGHGFFGHPGIPLPIPGPDGRYPRGGTRLGNARARDAAWALLLDQFG
jgi:hypothetical protein